MNNSRIEKSSKNAITAVVQNFFNIILAFVARIIFVHVLDESYLGINGLFSNIINVLSVADMGMGTAMMYSLYGPLAQQDEDRINALIAFFKKVYLIIALVVLIVGIALIPILPMIVNLEHPIEMLEIYYLLALFNVVSTYLFVYRTTLIIADQKSYLLNNCNLIFKIISFVLQTVFLLAFENYLVYLLIELLVNVLNYLVQNFMALKKYPYLRKRAESLEKSDKKEIGKNVKSLFMYKICGIAQGNTDSILISIICGTVFVGYYSNYLIVINAITSVITVVFNSVKASVGNLIVSDEKTDTGKQQVYWVLECINFWLVGFSAVCFYCLFDDCIKIFFGEQYVLAKPVLIAIILNFYSLNICQAIWVFRETTGLFNTAKNIAFWTALLNLGISIVLGIKWGIFGILIATTISRFSYMMWKEPQLLFENYLGHGLKRYYIMYVKNILWVVGVMVITNLFCSIPKIGNIFLNFGIKIAICLVIPNVCFLIRYLKTQEFRYIWNSLLKYYNNRRNK